MCTYSMIADHYQGIFMAQPWYQNPDAITRMEFNELKRQVEEMAQLLRRAKKYDEETGQRDCEMEEKVALLRKVADIVGVDLRDVTE